MEVIVCLWCNEPLRFEKGKGWVHSDGQLYKGECYCDIEIKHEKSNECPTWRDSHCAMPNRVGNFKQ